MKSRHLVGQLPRDTLELTKRKEEVEGHALSESNDDLERPAQLLLEVFKVNMPKIYTTSFGTILDNLP